MGKSWVEHFSEREQVICISETESLLVFYCKRLAQIYGFKIAQICYLTVLEAKGLKWVLFSLVAQLCLTLCDPIDCSTLGLPVYHQHSELAQTHVHRFGDAIQPSVPLPSPSSPAFDLSQDQGLF